MPRIHRMLDHLSILSANVRGFQTNLGDLTHSYVIPHTPDVIATVETFLNPTVPENFGKISGYSKWHRRDRTHGTFGGIAVCFRKSLHVQPIEINIPDHFELMFFRLWTNTHDSILLCVCYRPQWQGSEPLIYLQDHLDNILNQYSCSHIIIVGDLNQYLVARTYEDLLVTHGLTNHVNFPTHISGSSLDPVITDLPDNDVRCLCMGTTGSSDHYAILSELSIRTTRDETVNRTTWLWDRANWQSLGDALDIVVWDNILTGSVNDQASALTNLLVSLQSKYVPNKTYKAKSWDQPWFGVNCRIAADAKINAWNKLKRHPSRQNKQLHIAACRRMKKTQKWAIKRWKDDLRTKLTGRSVGSKAWWSCVKQQQGFAPDDCLPPLDNSDGSVAHSSRDKAELLASFFSEKMNVEDPDRQAPKLPPVTHSKLCDITVTVEEVRKHLLAVDVNKALGPDKISPYTLHRCANQLAGPLTSLFQTCLQQRTWPKIWKSANVVAVHKNKSKTLPENYRPISLLSSVGKIYEKVLVNRMTKFFDLNHLLNTRQFGFRSQRSASDLLLQLSSTWNKALDAGKDTFVIALDIAGAFDRVWHKGIITKLESLGIDGNLLMLVQDYLQGRTLQVVVNGHTSSAHPIQASVPQGSVIGPLLWNVYFNDLLQIIPEAHAYADDCTLSFSCDSKAHSDTVSHINDTLAHIISWSKRWQVTLAPDKTQAMVISRRQVMQNTRAAAMQLDGKDLRYGNEINILGVCIDNHLCFTNHVKDLAKRAAKKLACIRRIAPLLDSKGCSTLYNSQVRSLMEYSPLVWSSCPPSYLTLLDRVQNRARRLVEFKAHHTDQPIHFQSLQHRRDVAALCVLYKVHKECIPHLASLRLPPAVAMVHTTRNAHNRIQELQIPFARTELYLRSFQPKYSRLWNSLVQQTDLCEQTTLTRFKSAVHLWRLRS